MKRRSFSDSALLVPTLQRLRSLSFPSLTAREALTLFHAGIWEDIEVGASLVTHDRARAQFSVILRGVADVIMHGATVAELGEGQFVGELDERADERYDIDVLVKVRARLVCWDRN